MDVSYESWPEINPPNVEITTEVFIFEPDEDEINQEVQVQQDLDSSEASFECNLCRYKTSRNDRMKLHNKTHLLDSLPVVKIEGNDFIENVKSEQGLLEDSISRGSMQSSLSTFTSLELQQCKEMEGYNEKLSCIKTEPSLNYNMQGEKQEKDKFLTITIAERKSHPDVLSCKLCKFKTFAKTRYESHMQEHELGICYKCEKCNYTTIAKHIFDMHMRKHGYKCHYCYYKAGTLKNLQLHMQMHHKTEHAFSINIGKVKERNETKASETGSSPEMPFQCEKCSYKTLREDYLVQHQVHHFISNSYMCKECGTMFALQRSLMLHMTTHLKDKD